MSVSTHITTTSGHTFTTVESVDLARLVLKRFGNDLEEATAAWRRLLQNDATTGDFIGLIDYPEHTPHCEGSCQDEE